MMCVAERSVMFIFCARSKSCNVTLNIAEWWIHFIFADFPNHSFSTDYYGIFDKYLELLKLLSMVERVCTYIPIILLAYFCLLYNFLVSFDSYLAMPCLHKLSLLLFKESIYFLRSYFQWAKYYFSMLNVHQAARIEIDEMDSFYFIRVDIQCWKL